MIVLIYNCSLSIIKFFFTYFIQSHWYKIEKIHNYYYMFSLLLFNQNISPFHIGSNSLFFYNQLAPTIIWKML